MKNNLHPSLSPTEALQKLKDGNQRFIRGSRRYPRQDSESLQNSVQGQNPFAIVLGCSDSRVSPTLLFDQGVGDLFVIRVAGGIVDDSVLGSIQFGVESLGVSLVVVLGHESCGAVTAAIKTLGDQGAGEGYLGSLVQSIWPAVERAKSETGDLLENAIIANSQLSAQAITKADFMQLPVQGGSVQVVGGYYQLESGQVNWVF